MSNTQENRVKINCIVLKHDAKAFTLISFTAAHQWWAGIPRPEKCFLLCV